MKRTDIEKILPILVPVLGEDLARAIIEHRDDVVRVPLTEMAARLQAKEYLATGHPREAAEMQILRGWRAIKRSWFENEIRRDERNSSRRTNDVDMANFAGEFLSYANARIPH